MRTTKISTKAPGKMILLGEYAVLEGAPALVTAVNRFAYVTISENNQAEYILKAPSIGINEEPFVISKSGSVRFNPALPPQIENRLGLFSGIFKSILINILHTTPNECSVVNIRENYEFKKLVEIRKIDE